MRQYTFVALVIGSLPAPKEFEAGKFDRDTYARRAAAMVGAAAETFNDGLRAYYFAFAALAWFVSPMAMVLATLPGGRHPLQPGIPFGCAARFTRPVKLAGQTVPFNRRSDTAAKTRPSAAPNMTSSATCCSVAMVDQAIARHCAADNHLKAAGAWICLRMRCNQQAPKTAVATCRDGQALPAASTPLTMASPGV